MTPDARLLSILLVMAVALGGCSSGITATLSFDRVLAIIAIGVSVYVFVVQRRDGDKSEERFAAMHREALEIQKRTLILEERDRVPEFTIEAAIKNRESHSRIDGKMVAEQTPYLTAVVKNSGAKPVFLASVRVEFFIGSEVRRVSLQVRERPKEFVNSSRLPPVGPGERAIYETSLYFTPFKSAKLVKVVAEPEVGLPQECVPTDLRNKPMESI